MVKKYMLAASGAALWFPTFATAQTAMFEGPRVQFDLAYDQLDANDDYPDLPRHLDAAYLGATIGYDHAVADGVILGGEIGFGKPLGGRERATLGEDAVSVKPGREWTVGVRLGTIITGSTLAFATAGYSNAGLNATYESPAAPTGERTRYDASKGGFLWGFGVEQAIGGRAFASLAFRSAQYGNYAYERGVKRTQIRAGLGMRF